AAVDVSVLAPAGVAVAVSPEAAPGSAGARRHYRFDNPKTRAVTVRLKKPGAIALAGTDARTGPYFAVGLRVDADGARPRAPLKPALAEPGAKDAAAPAPTAVFLVDTSLSSNPDKLNVWLKLLEAILENNRASLKRFAVLFFNVETLWYRPELVENTP